MMEAKEDDGTNSVEFTSKGDREVVTQIFFRMAYSVAGGPARSMKAPRRSSSASAARGVKSAKSVDARNPSPFSRFSRLSRKLSHRASVGDLRGDKTSLVVASERISQV